MNSIHARTATISTLLLYVALTFVWMQPLLPVMSSALPHDAGDPLLNAWILWWNSRVIPFSTTWWNAPSFYPLSGMAGLTELLVSLNIIASPVIWVSHNPVLAYNVVFLLSFILSAFAEYLLCLELTGHRPAAILGGLAFGFAPYRIAQLPHLQVLASFWMPVALLALHRYARTRAKRWLVVFGVFYVAQALSNGYYLLFFSVLLCFWIAWFLARTSEWHAVAAVSSALAIAAAPLVPILLGYQSVQRHYGLTRRLDEILFYSGDVTAFLTPPSGTVLWGWFQRFAHPEGELFPGLSIVLLILLGVVLTFRREHIERKTSRVRLALAGAAIVAGAVSLSFLTFGAWRLELGGVVLLSVGHFHKPFSVFLVLGSAFMLSGPRAARRLRDRSTFAFYLLATILSALACLGPEPRMLGQTVLYKPPYSLLLSLPGFNGLRVPTRFWMLGTLCLGVCGAFAFARLAPRISRRSTLAAVLVAAGIMIDGWPSRLPVAQAPQTIRCAGPTSADVKAFLQLPIGGTEPDLAAMYRAADLGLPAVNGFSGYYPPEYYPLTFSLQRHNPDVLVDIASFGKLEVVVDGSRDPDGSWAAYVRDAPGARQLPGCSPDQIQVFEIDATRRRQPPPIRGTRLHVVSVTADINPEIVGNVLDKDLTSRWAGGPQTRAHWLRIDLGQPRPVRRLTLALGAFPLDFPRRVRIDLSTDGLSWRTVHEDDADREALWGAIRKPRATPLSFPLGEVTGRYIRVTQTGFDPRYHWSVAELNVFGPGLDVP